MPYSKTVWQAGDLINQVGMNNLEDGVETAQNEIDAHEALTNNPHGVTASQIGAAAILTQIKTVDGAGSGLDADLLDGQSSAFYQNAGNLNAGTIAAARFGSSTVGIGVLKTGTGNANSTNPFNVSRYAFGSPEIAAGGGSSIIVSPYKAASTTGRQWRARNVGTDSPGVAPTVTWDYVTASGNPRVWAEIDVSGNIIGMWEAEDPANDEFPDEQPLHPDADSGLRVQRLELPSEQLLARLLEECAPTQRPSWHAASRYRHVDDPSALCKAVAGHQFAQRGLEVPDDIRGVYSEIDDYEKRYWRVQLWLRALSRVRHDHRNNSLIRLYQEVFRAGADGQLELR